MKKQITRFSIFQTSKVLSLMFIIPFAILAFSFGIFLILDGKPREGLSIIIMPFFSVIILFIYNAIILALYNFAAKYFGGIEIELNDCQDERT
jgi:hypothetical protein